MLRKGENETLESYLAKKVFAGNAGTRKAPDPKDVRSFELFMKRYTEGLHIERAAVKHLT
jgi:hypothetical protein